MGPKIRHLKDISQVENFDRRRAAVVKRIIASKDTPKKCSLFAWGRMTITIKDVNGETMELWKPKRREIIAVFADIYHNRKKLFRHLFPYQFGFEDSSGFNAPHTLLLAPEDDFIAIQEEMDHHWGVHKRKLCPGLARITDQPPASARPLPTASYLVPHPPLKASPTSMYESIIYPPAPLKAPISSLMSAAHMLSSLDPRWNSLHNEMALYSPPIPNPTDAYSYPPHGNHPSGYSFPTKYNTLTMKMSPREYDENLPLSSKPDPIAISSPSSPSHQKHWRPW